MRLTGWRVWLAAALTAWAVERGHHAAYWATWPPWPLAVHQEGVQAK